MNNQDYNQSFVLNLDETNFDYIDMQSISQTERFKLKPLKSLCSKKPDNVEIGSVYQKVQKLKNSVSSEQLQLNYIQNKVIRQKFNKYEIKLDIQAIDQLQNETEMKVWDTNKYKYDSEQAETQLYKYYKNIDRVIEQNQISAETVKNSAYTAMCEKMKSLYPRKLGIIKPNGDLKKIELNSLEINIWRHYLWEVNAYQMQNIFAYPTIE